MRQGATAGAASAALAVIFLLSAADAAQPTLREVERRRVSAEADRRRLEAEARMADREIEQLNQKLAAADRERRAAELEVAALEGDVGRLMADERWSQRQSARSAAVLDRALITLVRPNRDPATTMAAATAGRALAHRTSASLRAADVAQDRRRSLAARRADLAVAQARLDSATVEMRGAINAQQARRAILNADASRANARATALAAQTRSLRELVARTTSRIGPRTAAAAPARPRSTPAAAVLAAARLAPDASVVRRFGERLQHGTAQGLTLRTRPGGQITAPFAAKVVWAGPFRSYGSVLILDPGDDCAIVLAGMSLTLVRDGQTVRQGQPLAQMAIDATPAPELYVEVRRGGDPVDPVPWLNAGSVTNRAIVR